MLTKDDAGGGGISQKVTKNDRGLGWVVLVWPLSQCLNRYFLKTLTLCNWPTHVPGYEITFFGLS